MGLFGGMAGRQVKAQERRANGTVHATRLPINHAKPLSQFVQSITSPLSVIHSTQAYTDITMASVSKAPLVWIDCEVCLQKLS